MRLRVADLVGAAFLLVVLILILDVPPTDALLKSKAKLVVVTNSHTNYLSLRCFSFDDSFNVTHLAPGQQFRFRVRKRVIYPSSTMFNCSTNIGTFIAFKYDYQCVRGQYETCEWRFDENGAYRWEPLLNTWATVEFSPSYESLDRGGVIESFYAN